MIARSLVSFLLGLMVSSTPLWGQVATDKDGFQIHKLPSVYQAADTSVRVLLPDELQEHKRYRVLYVLPVAMTWSVVHFYLASRTLRDDLANAPH